MISFSFVNNINSKKQIKSLFVFVFALFFSFCGFGSSVAQAADGFGKCKDVKEVLAGYMTKCNACELFEVIFDAASQVSAQAFSAVAPGCQGLIWVGCLLWFILELMKFLSSLTEVDIMEFWTKAGKQFFAAFFAISILSGGLDVYEFFFAPPIMAAFEFADAVTPHSSCNLEAAPAATSGAFPPSMKVGLRCMIEGIKEEVAFVKAIGSVLMCIAIKHDKTFFIPNISMLLQGLSIYIIASIVIFVFPFYLIDAALRLGIVGAMMPLFVAAWVFKATRSFAVKGWNMLLSTVFLFIAMSIIAILDMQLLGSLIGSLDGLEAAFNSGKVKKIEEILEMSSAGFLQTCAIGYFVIKLIQKCDPIAKHFSETGFDSGIGSKLGGMAVKAISTPAQRAGAAVAGGATRMVRAGAKGGARAMISSYQKGRESRTAQRQAKFTNKTKSQTQTLRDLNKNYRAGGGKGVGYRQDKTGQIYKPPKNKSATMAQNKQILRNNKKAQGMGAASRFAQKTAVTRALSTIKRRALKEVKDKIKKSVDYKG